MFSYIQSFFENPKTMLIFVLLSLPGRALALSMHEWAHAYVADRCGDPTARIMGRLSLNPARHLDLLGTILLMLAGIGWAKPVPIDPRNYKNPRRDDVLVSLAGITMNLILFVIGFLLLNVFLTVALRALPGYAEALTNGAETYVTYYNGQNVMVTGGYYYTLSSIFEGSMYVQEIVIAPALGRLAGYVYQMLVYFVQVNLSLAIFNLLPIPPLDGYHVLNDTILHRPLFAQARTARIAMGILFVLCMTGILGKGLSYVLTAVTSGLGGAFGALVTSIGIL